MSESHFSYLYFYWNWIQEYSKVTFFPITTGKNTSVSQWEPMAIPTPSPYSLMFTSNVSTDVTPTNNFHSSDSPQLLSSLPSHPKYFSSSFSHKSVRFILFYKKQNWKKFEWLSLTLLVTFFLSTVLQKGSLEELWGSEIANISHQVRTSNGRKYDLFMNSSFQHPTELSTSLITDPSPLPTTMSNVMLDSSLVSTTSSSLKTGVLNKNSNKRLIQETEEKHHKHPKR